MCTINQVSNVIEFITSNLDSDLFEAYKYFYSVATHLTIEQKTFKKIINLFLKLFPLFLCLIFDEI